MATNEQIKGWLTFLKKKIDTEESILMATPACDKLLPIVYLPGCYLNTNVKDIKNSGITI